MKKEKKLRNENKLDENQKTASKQSENSGFAFQLRKDFTFENLVEGESNRMAVTCAKQFLDFPDIDLKTLFLCGKHDVGKTHLVQAIGNWFLQNNNNCKAIYVPSELFVLNYISALQSGHINKFRNYYRSADIFLLDDIQFFEGKDKSLEELFHTYEFLRNRSKVIVFCSVLPPSQMNIERRLLTRLSQHFVVNIKNPSDLTQRAIIEKKCQLFKFSLPPNLMECLANSGITSVRMIEGIIFNLNWLEKHGKEINLSIIEETIANILPSKAVNSEHTLPS